MLLCSIVSLHESRKDGRGEIQYIIISALFLTYIAIRPALALAQKSSDRNDTELCHLYAVGVAHRTYFLQCCQVSSEWRKIYCSLSLINKYSFTMIAKLQAHNN
jgi:hypothetical protein